MSTSRYLTRHYNNLRLWTRFDYIFSTISIWAESTWENWLEMNLCFLTLFSPHIRHTILLMSTFFFFYVVAIKTIFCWRKNNIHWNLNAQNIKWTFLGKKWGLSETCTSSIWNHNLFINVKEAFTNVCWMIKWMNKKLAVRISLQLLGAGVATERDVFLICP